MIFAFYVYFRINVEYIHWNTPNYSYYMLVNHSESMIVINDWSIETYDIYLTHYVIGHEGLSLLLINLFQWKKYMWLCLTNMAP